MSIIKTIAKPMRGKWIGDNFAYKWEEQDIEDKIKSNNNSSW